jgi:putative aldouronate transport system substrate-binding protein
MPSVSLTDEESTQYSLYWSDISTYARENILKFIVGARSMDEYDSYLDEMLNVVGGNEAIAIYQKALDEYLG